MMCAKPVRLTKNLDRKKYPDGLEVPCGKCLACRIKKRSEWVLRLTHELDYYPDSSFLTLTYSDDHLPYGEMGLPTLRKDHLQKFIKRVRKNLPPDYKIKYYGCGEYGDQTQRPHYHLIMMGLGLQYEHKKLITDAWPLCDWSNNEIYTNSFGLAEPDSIRYVAQYIDKKFTGELADAEYKDKGREPVFRLLSQGLGLRYAQAHEEQIKQRSGITLNGTQQSIPRYYIKKLDIDTQSLTDHALTTELDTVERIIGVRLSRDDVYMHYDARTIIKLEESIRASQQQHNNNLAAKIALKTKKL